MCYIDLLNMTAVLSPIFSKIQHIGMQNIQNMIFSQSAIMATVESVHDEGLEYSMARAMGPYVFHKVHCAIKKEGIFEN